MRRTSSKSLYRRYAPIAAVLCCLLSASLLSVQGWAQTAAREPTNSGSANPAVTPKDRLSEPWWAARHQAIVAGLAGHADTQLLLIGDSITNDYDLANPPNQDFQPIWQKYYAPRRALNLGFGGDTTANVLWRLDHGEVDGLHPKLAVVLIGTNNTSSGQTAEQTEAGIDAVVADVERHLPGTKVLLLGILPTALPSREQNFDVNSYLGLRYAGGKDSLVSYMDIGVVFYTGGTLDDSLFYDGYQKPPRPSLHPDTLGQLRMASAIEPTVARLMGDTPVKFSQAPATASASISAPSATPAASSATPAGPSAQP